MSSLAGEVRTRPRVLASMGWMRARPELGVETVALFASLFFALVSNIAFFRTIAATSELQHAGGWTTAASLFVAIVACHMLLFCMLFNRWTIKPALTILLLATSAASYFMTRYTTYFDTDMVRNVLQTDAKESSELLTGGLLLSVLVNGVLPSLLTWRIRIKPRPARRAFMVRIVYCAASALVAGAAILSSFQGISSLMRNHKEVRYLIAPGNYLVSLVQYASRDGMARDGSKQPVGTDAVATMRQVGSRRRVLVLVVGETVRAHNWGLNGYARQTTPKLQRLAPVNFSDVTACGSSTEVSLPCMFSPYGRADYDEDRIRHSESMLHVLQRAGIETLWRDNQSGCKGVCDGLAFESFERDSDPVLCDRERCLDEVMLRDLDRYVQARSGDIVVVLHAIGNHGPSYFRRYPESARRFVPDCRTPELSKCDRREIVNAYDNAVLYTDRFLAKAIRMLSDQDSLDTALIYVSDHGESLGEGGLYLHGVPYAIAPETQLKVPMVLWMSPGFASDRGIDLGCMKRRSSAPISHDHLFHSVLGLMQVRTRDYKSDRDVFFPCGRDRTASRRI